MLLHLRRASCDTCRGDLARGGKSLLTWLAPIVAGSAGPWLMGPRWGCRGVSRGMSRKCRGGWRAGCLACLLSGWAASLLTGWLTHPLIYRLTGLLAFPSNHPAIESACDKCRGEGPQPDARPPVTQCRRNSGHRSKSLH